MLSLTHQHGHSLGSCMTQLTVWGAYKMSWLFSCCTGFQPIMSPYSKRHANFIIHLSIIKQNRATRRGCLSIYSAPSEQMSYRPTSLVFEIANITEMELLEMTGYCRIASVLSAVIQYIIKRGDQTQISLTWRQKVNIWVKQYNSDVLMRFFYQLCKFYNYIPKKKVLFHSSILIKKYSC